MQHLRQSQIAAANYHYARHSFGYFLNSMEELDVHNIELYAGYPHLSVEDASEQDVREIAKALRARDIRVCCLTQEQGGAVPINIATENDAVRARSIRAFARCIRFATLLGAGKVLVLPGRGSYDLPEEGAFARAADSLAQIARVAEECGIKLVIESSSYHNTNVGYSAARVRALIDEVQSPALLGMIDTCSIAKAEEDFAEVYRMFDPKMGHVHFADGNPMGHLVPGDGNLPLASWVQMLDDFGYTGDIAFELYNWQYDFDPHLHMRRALEFLRGLIKA